VILTDFVATPPPYEVAQDRLFDWLAEAHAAAARDADFATTVRRVLGRCGCPPSKIARRGLSVPLELDGHRIYDIAAGDPRGAGSGARTQLFAELVDAYFTGAYADEQDAPDELVHVTCTGYVSPSGAQKLVAAKRWPTRVTHAYQMGCYAAVPAVRIARGLLCDARRVDIVHTELCSLHMDPSDHRLEQLVVQSLFADGLIRYSMRTAGSGLAVRAIHEVIVPDTSQMMSWTVGDHGMHMTLAREVPAKIAGVLREFVAQLFARAGLDLGALRDSAFAVHPGGPRIVDGVQEVLELRDEQLLASRAVLRDHGNMSSATIPHIWSRLLDTLPRGTFVPSLAFGPGLSVCGALLERV
jgi:predicted naringenin-chalcone synthase